MAFAIDPGRTATAYALTDAEIRPVLRRAPAHAVDTGALPSAEPATSACAVGRDANDPGAARVVGAATVRVGLSRPR